MFNFFNKSNKNKSTVERAGDSGHQEYVVKEPIKVQNADVSDKVDSDDAVEEKQEPTVIRKVAGIFNPVRPVKKQMAYLQKKKENLNNTRRFGMAMVIGAIKELRVIKNEKTRTVEEFERDWNVDDSSRDEIIRNMRSQRRWYLFLGAALTVFYPVMLVSFNMSMVSWALTIAVVSLMLLYVLGRILLISHELAVLAERRAVTLYQYVMGK